MFCRNCGKELKENAKFCSQCGKQVIDDSPDPEPIVIPETEKKQYTYNAYEQPNREEPQSGAAPTGAPEIPPEYRPLSPWAYFGYMLLFSIPIVGFVLLIVFSFVGGNINRRNFARSYWCGVILGLAITLILLVLVFAGVLRGPLESAILWLSDNGLKGLSALLH